MDRIFGGNKKSAKDDKYFYVLDGLRGIASVAIVIRHTPRFFSSIALPDSFLAVDLFFVLSGFVLAANYEKKFEAGMTVKDFGLGRLIRLYPLYLVGLLLGFLSALLSINHVGLEVKWTYQTLLFSLIPNFFMLPSPYPNNVHYLYPFNPVMWSIFFELIINVFYIISYKFSKNLKTFLSFLSLSGVLLIVTAFDYGTLNSGFDWNSFFVGFARVLYSFPIGVLLYRLSRGQKNIRFIKPYFLFLFIVVLFALSMKVLAQLLSVLIIFPAIVYVAALIPISEIEARIYSFLGLTSYGIYALHKSIYQLMLGGFIKSGLQITDPFFHFVGPFFIIFIFLLSALIEIKVDSPSRLLLKKYFLPSKPLFK